MTDLRDFLLRDPLGASHHAAVAQEVRERFDERLLPNDGSSFAFGLLRKFVVERPWRYWDLGTVEAALTLLERDTARTLAAFDRCAGEMDRGLENLMRPGPLAVEEQAIHQHARDLVRLATEFHPEFLRITEHVFGNLLAVYWAISKKGSVEGRYELKNACDLLSARGHVDLLRGYNDRIRNAVAHGAVVFTGTGIRYGPRPEHEMTARQFLGELDQLIRTSNALAIAVVIFAMRNREVVREWHALPLAFAVAFAAGALDRPGFRVFGGVESEIPRVGRQLHVAVETPFRNRTLVMWDSARIAMHLIENGASEYDRLLVEVDQGEEVNSLAIIRLQRLARLAKEGAAQDRLGEIFDSTQLLWLDESVWRTRLRAWRLIAVTAWRAAKDSIRQQWDASGFRVNPDRWRIRRIKNVSAMGQPRVKVFAVLRRAEDAQNPELVPRICQAIVRSCRRRRVNSRPGLLDEGIGWRKKPKQVFLALYRIDGTIRWLESGGWASGNVVAICEYRKNDSLDPVFVRNAEETWKGLRFRYQLDLQEFGEAMENLHGSLKDMAAREGPGKGRSS